MSVFFFFFFFLGGGGGEEGEAGMAQWWEHSPRSDSTPEFGVMCGLSFLLVLVLAPRGFSPDTTVFPVSSKTNTSKFQFDLESVAS